MDNVILNNARIKLAGILDNRVTRLMNSIAPKFQEDVFNKLSPELQELMLKGLGSKIKDGLGATALVTGLNSTPFGALAGLYHTYTTGKEGENSPGFSDYLKNSLIGAGISGTMGAIAPTALRLYQNNKGLKGKLQHMEEDFLSDIARGRASHYMNPSNWVDRWKVKYNI